MTTVVAASFGQQVAFWVTAVVMAVGAVRVVTARNVVHAALYLVVTLAGVAAIYIQLTAEFIAWVQVLIYIGAVLVLLLFGVMLTRAPIGREALDNEQRPIALLAGLSLFGTLTAILVDTFRDTTVELTSDTVTTTAAIGEQLFSRWVIPFEVVSVLLLAALIGSVVLARKDSPRRRGGGASVPAVRPRAGEQR